MSRCALALPALLLLLAFGARPGPAQELEFLRGDVNADGNISTSDALMLRRWLFNGDRPPPCHDAADFDDSGMLNITDQIQILVFAFLDNARAPAQPFPDPGVDPTPDDVACESYDVVAPEATDDLIDIGEIEAGAGEEVLVPVFVTNSVPVEAFQLVIKYDPDEVKIVEGVGNRDTRFWEGSFYEEPFTGGNPPPMFFAVTPHARAGFFTVGLVPDLVGIDVPELPPGELTHAFNLIVVTDDQVRPGTRIELMPTDGPDGEGFGPAKIRNELTHRGEARFVTLTPRTEGGFIQIVGDQTFFSRGDVNSDGKLELSDAQLTLNFLFIDVNVQPVCFDAADSNDDGRIDIADPVAVLAFLFLGGPELPPPTFPTRGVDPTPDDIDCFSFSP